MKENLFLQEYFPNGVPTQPDLTAYSNAKKVEIIIGRIIMLHNKPTESSFPSRSDHINLQNALQKYQERKIIPRKKSWIRTFLLMLKNIEGKLWFVFDFFYDLLTKGKRDGERLDRITDEICLYLNPTFSVAA